MPQRALDPGTDSMTVSIRVPKAVKKSYQERAKRSGRTLSEWVRNQLDHDVPLPKLQGSAIQMKPPPAPKHVHTMAGHHNNNGREIPICTCGSLFVPDDKGGRWV